MKKKLVLLCLGVFLLCGCELKEEATFTINEDKSMNIEVVAGFDDELIDALISMSESGSSEEEETDLEEELNQEQTENDEELDFGFDMQTKEYTDEERKNYLSENLKSEYNMSELEAKGIKIVEYQDEKYMGYKITGTIKNIDDLIGTPDFNLDDIEEINSKKIFEKNGKVYKGKIMVGDPTGKNEESSSSTAGINLIYTFTLNLPNKAISSNATNVSEDGKTLKWNLASENINAIQFEFKFPSKFAFLTDNMFVVAGIAVAIVLIVVILVTLLIKKSKKKNTTNELNNNSNNNIVTNEQNQQVMQNNMQPLEQPTLNQENNINVQNPAQQPINNQMQEQSIQEVQQIPNVQMNNQVIEAQMPLQEVSAIQSGMQGEMRVEQTIPLQQNEIIGNVVTQNPVMQSPELMMQQPIQEIQQTPNMQTNNQIIGAQMPLQEVPIMQEEIRVEQTMPVHSTEPIGNEIDMINQIPVMQQPGQTLQNPIEQTQPYIEQQVMTENQIVAPQQVVPQQINSYPLPINQQPQEQPNIIQQGMTFVTGEQQNNNINNQGI